MPVFYQLILAWLAGLYLGWWLEIHSFCFWGFLVGLFVYVLIFKGLLRIGDKSQWLHQLILMLLTFLAGACHMSGRYPPISDFHTDTKVTQKLFVKEVLHNPFKQQLIVSFPIETNKRQTRCRKVLVLLEVSNLPEIQIGDSIALTARLEKIPPPELFGEFNKRAFWAGKGARYELVPLGPIDFHTQNQPSAWFESGIQKLRDFLLTTIADMNIKPENKGIVKGMLMGDKSDLDKGQKERFSGSGIMHLLAVSGLHVGLVYLMLIKLCTAIGVPKNTWYGQFLCLLLVFVYVGICGFPPSAVRAALLLSLYALSLSSGRHQNGIHLVFLCLWIHSLINPVSIFSVGFQLSYLAIFGILLFFGRLQRLWSSRWWLVKKARDLACLSLSAQSLTLPLSILTFGRFPMYFLLGNLILMPFGLLCFYYAVFVLILAVMGIRLDALFQILDKGLDSWYGIASWISAFPMSQLEWHSYPYLELLFYLVSLFYFSGGLRRVFSPPYGWLFFLVGWSAASFLFIICRLLLERIVFL